MINPIDNRKDLFGLEIKKTPEISPQINDSVLLSGEKKQETPYEKAIKLLKSGNNIINNGSKIKRTGLLITLSGIVAAIITPPLGGFIALGGIGAGILGVKNMDKGYIQSQKAYEQLKFIDNPGEIKTVIDEIETTTKSYLRLF